MPHLIFKEQFRILQDLPVKIIDAVILPENRKPSTGGYRKYFAGLLPALPPECFPKTTTGVFYHKPEMCK
ncbi:MAG: hypothetical protein LBH00_00205 [Planctomycetaceae bacterium]|nr:hypothetical protein [Planctomycetaceae bacterium]